MGVGKKFFIDKIFFELYQEGAQWWRIIERSCRVTKFICINIDPLRWLVSIVGDCGASEGSYGFYKIRRKGNQTLVVAQRCFNKLVVFCCCWNMGRTSGKVLSDSGRFKGGGVEEVWGSSSRGLLIFLYINFGKKSSCEVCVFSSNGCTLEVFFHGGCKEISWENCSSTDASCPPNRDNVSSKRWLV